MHRSVFVLFESQYFAQLRDSKAKLVFKLNMRRRKNMNKTTAGVLLGQTMANNFVFCCRFNEYLNGIEKKNPNSEWWTTIFHRNITVDEPEKCLNKSPPEKKEFSWKTPTDINAGVRIIYMGNSIKLWPMRWQNFAIQRFASKAMTIALIYGSYLCEVLSENIIFPCFTFHIILSICMWYSLHRICAIVWLSQWAFWARLW